MTRGTYWMAWGVMTLGATGGLGWSLLSGRQEIFLPDHTTAGHYQIEEACASCHTPMQGVTSEPCLKCHAEALTASDDSHPRKKFTDPRNADLLARLDAIACVSCHKEHNPGITRTMGVTMPADYCRLCHADVGKERPSHREFAFTTCASAGCHRYHDNTALYEDFLVAHANEPATKPRPQVVERTTATTLLARGHRPGPALTRDLQDAPAAVRVMPQVLAEWSASAHARGGVNCTGCHVTPASSGAAWTDAPAPSACATCHDAEVSGFLRGRHGMRIEAGLSPMRPALARIPMRADAANHDLTCASCHGGHQFEAQVAAVDGCSGCHADTHTTAYRASPHYALWVRERAGEAPTGTGVSCATCHLPRLPVTDGGGDLVFVQHNQNSNLRPSERMARDVCLQCHGLGFSLDALADSRLVAANFNGRPTRHVESIDLAVSRVRTGSK